MKWLLFVVCLFASPACANDVKVTFTEEEARVAMKSDGWSATKVGEDWINLCPTCQEDD